MNAGPVKSAADVVTHGLGATVMVLIGARSFVAHRASRMTDWAALPCHWMRPRLVSAEPMRADPMTV